MGERQEFASTIDRERQAWTNQMEETARLVSENRMQLGHCCKDMIEDKRERVAEHAVLWEKLAEVATSASTQLSDQGELLSHQKKEHKEQYQKLDRRFREIPQAVLCVVKGAAQESSRGHQSHRQGHRDKERDRDHAHAKGQVHTRSEAKREEPKQ